MSFSGSEATNVSIVAAEIGGSAFGVGIAGTVSGDTATDDVADADSDPFGADAVTVLGVAADGAASSLPQPASPKPIAHAAVNAATRAPRTFVDLLMALLLPID